MILKTKKSFQDILCIQPSFVYLVNPEQGSVDLLCKGAVNNRLGRLHTISVGHSSLYFLTTLSKCKTIFNSRASQKTGCWLLSSKPCSRGLQIFRIYFQVYEPEPLKGRVSSSVLLHLIWVWFCNFAFFWFNEYPRKISQYWKEQWASFRWSGSWLSLVNWGNIVCLLWA